MADGGFCGNATVAALSGAVGGGIVSFLIAWLADTRARFIVQSEGFGQILEELAVDSGAYWRSSGQDPALERKIIAELERLDLRCDILKGFRKIRKHGGHMTDLLDLLTTASTGGDFEVHGRAPDVARADKIKNLVRQFREIISPDR